MLELTRVLPTILFHPLLLCRFTKKYYKISGKAQLCVLSSNCDKNEYLQLVEALCAAHEVDLIKVEDGKKLGEWAGLCKIDKEGNPRKVVGCSCVVVKDYGQEGDALDVLKGHFKSS